ncbi:MAG TPA: HAD-IB family phosphatase [Ferruginibacter sp.]|nr:HAD-IB family phosphatase [Ferruginibacter sp.]HMP21531.1 HAD-IB family phosphatase [Ferruginibacter sp.]
MITVVIPALNEEKTVGEVVALALATPNVSEVIVVDDKSMDNTVDEARKAGATVITSTKLGKGTSMKEGVLVAKNDTITFLDADITTYQQDVITLLCTPILNDEADFVKSYFTRQAGRVTELVAKPLLSILYPDFPQFLQPLSGMIAGKKSYFAKCEFEEGYGVDIGILIDMYKMGARIQEVNIGNIENRMQPLEQLGKMSREVARTIMKKAKDKSPQNLETYENIQVIREQMEFAIRESLMSLKKIAMFDMDNTIIRQSFINTAAKHFGFTDELVNIVTGNNNPFIRTKMIARLLKGKTIGELLEVIDSVPVTPYITEIVAALKEQGYITGIISDSYDCITNHLKNKYGFDFTIANELEFSKSIATGEVKIPSVFLADEHSQCKHDYCKLNALINVCIKYGVDLKNTLVVGDGENDICCIRKAGIGVSFCSTNGLVDTVADYIIKDADFKLLEPILE